MKTARIHYFSATGNTERAVKVVKKKFEQKEYVVDVIEITKKTGVEFKNYDLEIFAFPVLAFAAPAFVRKYFRRLPYGNGRKAAVLACNGGDPLQANENAEKILTKKGYFVICSSGVVYPSNWTQIVSPASLEKTDNKLTSGDRSTEIFAENAIENNNQFYRKKGMLNNLSKIVSFLYTMFGRRFLGKLFIADDLCNSCSLCAKSCPAGTIVMKDGKKLLPYWRFNCENCNRCINICPQKSIQTSIGRLLLFGFLHILLIGASIASVIKITPFLLQYFGIYLSLFFDIVLGFFLLTGLTYFEFTLLDQLIFLLQNISFLKPFFQWTFTKNYIRYKAPGFVPNIYRKSVK